MRTRREHDSLGPVEVPEDRLWGAQTQRSLENFPIGRGRFVWGRPVIRAFGLLKKAAALANHELGQLPAATAEAIARAADEVIAGNHDSEFPLVVFQTGSGTQSNMNANEVIARRAGQIAGGARNFTRTTTSTAASRRTTRSRRSCTSPPSWRSRGDAAAGARPNCATRSPSAAVPCRTSC